MSVSPVASPDRSLHLPGHAESLSRQQGRPHVGLSLVFHRNHRGSNVAWREHPCSKCFKDNWSSWTTETYLKYWRVGSGHNTDCLCLCLPMLQIPRYWHQTYRGHWPHLGRGDTDRSDTWKVMGWPPDYSGFHVLCHWKIQFVAIHLKLWNVLYI